MIQNRLCWVMLSCLILSILSSCGGGETVQEVRLERSHLPPNELIHLMAATGDLDSLKSLLQEDPRLIHATTVRNRNLLHTAALNGQNRVVQFLLEQGGNPNIPDDQDSFPAELALSEGHTSTQRLLQEAAARMSAP